MTADVGAGPGLVGRDHERERLVCALRAGRSVIVCGPPGIGKTALVRDVANRWDHVREGRLLLYAGDGSTRRRLLRCQAESLFLAVGRLDLPPRAGSAAWIGSDRELRRFLAVATLPVLRCALAAALRARAWGTIVDHPNARGARLETYVANLLGEVPVVLVAEKPERLGRAANLLFAFDSIELGPLARCATEELAALWLPAADRDARRDLARESGGNPRRLRTLARLAKDESYWRDGRLALRLLAMDAKIEEVGLPMGEARAR